MLFIVATHAQDFTKDTIQLNNVFIDKNLKKAKLKKVKIGTHDLKYTTNLLFFTDDPIFYLTDSLPDGHV